MTIRGDSELMFISFAKPKNTFLVLYEKDTTIEPDSKQKMMSRWNQTESGSTSTNLEIEVPQNLVRRAQIEKLKPRNVVSKVQVNCGRVSP